MCVYSGFSVKTSAEVLEGHGVSNKSCKKFCFNAKKPEYTSSYFQNLSS